MSVNVSKIIFLLKLFYFCDPLYYLNICGPIFIVIVVFLYNLKEKKERERTN